MSAGKGLMKEPYKRIAGVVIELNSGHGAVRKVINDETTASDVSNDDFLKGLDILTP